MLDNVEPQKKETSVGMGSLLVSDDIHEVLTTFLGSCVGLCLYDYLAKVAGLAHIMLPGGEGKSPNSIFDAKYANHAFSALLRLMSQKGANERNLIAKIVGGAKMFSNEGISHPFALDIGERNAESIRLLLRHHQIPLISTDIGSDQGRWVWFHVSSGMLVVAKRSQKITL